MHRSVRRAGVVACLLALAAVTTFGGAAAAAPGKAKSPSQAMADAARQGSGGGGGLKVVADGLDNPRGIGFGPDGALYVAESGSGGPVAPGNCIASPEGGQACFGRTGAVTRITKRGQHRVLTGLPSVAEAGGVAALRLLDGALDVVLRHVLGAGGEDGGAQARIMVGVGQAVFRGDGDFARQLGEQLGALGVLLPLAEHDVLELRMAGHGDPFVLALFAR